MNSINIHGRLTRDPESKFYDGGSVCKISVAVERSYRGKDGKTETDFFNCTCFGKRAETIDKYFKKGDGISIQGEMQNRRYEDDNGNKRDGWQILIEKVDFEKTKKENAQPTSEVPEGFAPVDDSTEDAALPF